MSTLIWPPHLFVINIILQKDEKWSLENWGVSALLPLLLAIISASSTLASLSHTHTHTHTHLLDSLSLLRHVFFCQVFIIQLQWNDIGSS